MKIKLWAVLIILWIFFNITDAVTTIIAKYTLPYFNESSPIYVWGFGLWTLLLLKLFVTYVLAWNLLNKYNKRYPIFLRYFLVYFVTLLTVLLAFVTINNIEVLNMPKENIKEIPAEVRLNIYVEQIGDMKVVTNTTKKFKMPSIVPLFILNMIQFLIWRSFEKRIEDD